MFKKLGFLSALILGTFLVTNVYSRECPSACPPACPEDQRCGECYCLYVRYEPYCYHTQRCIEEQVPCTKRCCRYVPENYEVQRCRYVPEYYEVQRCRYVPEYYCETKCRQVPEYYCETKCRQVPEYYDVCEYKCCKKYVSEPNYDYKPVYYWKYECNNSCPSSSSSSCPSGSYDSYKNVPAGSYRK